MKHLPFCPCLQPAKLQPRSTLGAAVRKHSHAHPPSPESLPSSHERLATLPLAAAILGWWGWGEPQSGRGLIQSQPRSGVQMRGQAHDPLLGVRPRQREEAGVVSHLHTSQIVSPSKGREQEAWPDSPALGHLRNRKELRRETGRGCEQVVYGCLLSLGRHADFIRHERSANRRSCEIFSSVGWAETEGSHET